MSEGVGYKEECHDWDILSDLRDRMSALEERVEKLQHEVTGLVHTTDGIVDFIREHVIGGSNV